jgi:hypothetical protein
MSFAVLVVGILENIEYGLQVAQDKEHYGM